MKPALPATVLQRLASVPPWAWAALLALLVAPLYLRYFVWAAGAPAVTFWLPRA